MRISSRISFLSTIATLAMVVFSCANPGGGPSGGKRDTAGPEIIGTIPEKGTLNFNSRKVTFYFDEFLKPGNYKKEVFISPVPSEDPIVTVINKKLQIEFVGPLRENTTYVITLGSGLLDFNEGNKMETPYTYAFSTGNVLDSLTIGGTIRDMWTGEGVPEMKVLLYRSSEVEGMDFMDKRPEYVCLADKSGIFKFEFLAPGEYKVLAILDADNDFKYSSLGEKIAIAPEATLSLSGLDSVKKILDMVAFLPDVEGPRVKSAKWSNDYTIHLEFSEPVRQSFLSDSLSLEIADTLGNGSEPVKVMRQKFREPMHWYFHSPKPRNKDYDLKISFLMDSLGQRGDTVVRLTQLASVKEERNKFFEQPVNLRLGHDLFVPALIDLPYVLDSAKVQLLDSAGAFVSTVNRGMDFGFLVRPPRNLDPDMIYTLKINPSFPLPDGKTLDSTYKFLVRFPDPEKFGTIAGKILPDSTRPSERFVVIFKGKKGTLDLVKPIKPANSDAKEEKPTASKNKTVASKPDFFEERIAGPSSYKLIYLHPGNYTIDVIEDRDGNGVLTPGSLNPYRLPEKVYHQSKPLEVREKWDAENVDIYPIPPAGGKGKGANEGEEEVGKLDKPGEEEGKKPSGKPKK